MALTYAVRCLSSLVYLDPMLAVRELGDVVSIWPRVFLEEPGGTVSRFNAP